MKERDPASTPTPAGVWEGRGRPLRERGPGALWLRSSRQVDSSSGSLALASREMQVGFSQIWGAEGTPGPGFRTTTDQPHAAFVRLRLRRWIGGAPLMLFIWTSCLPSGVGDLCPHAIWLRGGPKALSLGATNSTSVVSS